MRDSGAVRVHVVSRLPFFPACSHLQRSTKGLTFAWHSSVSSVPAAACPPGKSSNGGSHFHEHAVVSGSSTLRYSSTHRVADTDGNTFSHVQQRCEQALAGGGAAAAAGVDDQILNLAQVRLLRYLCRVGYRLCGVRGWDISSSVFSFARRPLTTDALMYIVRRCTVSLISL